VVQKQKSCFLLTLFEQTVQPYISTIGLLVLIHITYVTLTHCTRGD